VRSTVYDSQYAGVQIVSSAYDLVVGGVITIIMFVLHRVGVEMFAPGSALYEIATDGTAVMNGTEHATTLFTVIAVWMPMLFIGGIWLWVAIRAWKRQVQTARPTPR
jgi:hypothetical protein